jgi:hypothetical protein
VRGRCAKTESLEEEEEGEGKILTKRKESRRHYDNDKREENTMLL